MASEAQAREDLSLLLPFLFGIATIDRSEADQDSANGPDPLTRIILMNPFMQGMVVIGDDALLQEKQGRPPASKAAIESLEAVEIEENEVGECAICLEEWSHGGETVKEMPCKHRFHGGCVEKWLGIHGSCPVCRFEMPIEQENGEKRSSGDGRERRVLVSLSFERRDGTGTRLNRDRSSSGDDHQVPSSSTDSDSSS